MVLREKTNIENSSLGSSGWNDILNDSNPFIPNSSETIKKEMLKEIGLSSIEDLYKDIPSQLRLKRKLDLPGPLSEYDVYRMAKEILGKNRTTEDMPIFLGAGVYPHYIPAVVKAIVSRGEFLTSYTPYD